MTPFPTLRLDHNNQTLTKGVPIKVREATFRLCKSLNPKLRDYNTQTWSWLPWWRSCFIFNSPKFHKIEVCTKKWKHMETNSMLIMNKLVCYLHMIVGLHLSFNRPKGMMCSTWFSKLGPWNRFWYQITWSHVFTYNDWYFVATRWKMGLIIKETPFINKIDDANFLLANFQYMLYEFYE
jgi:hypothetical protein